MPLFGRRSRGATPEPQPAAPVLGELACSEHSCRSTTGVACAYVDRRGNRCPTAWCPEHRSDVAGSTYCRRHAGVLRGMEGSETLGHPDVGSRAASLVAWVAADIDARMLALLENLREPGDEVRVQVARLVFLDRQRVRAWEHAWKLARHTGLGHWVAVQVTEDEDDVVDVIADGTHVVRGVPPWISARREGRALGPVDDAFARERYYVALLGAIQARLAEQAPDY